MYELNFYKCKIVKEGEPIYSSVNCANEAAQILRKIGLSDEAEEYFYLLCLDAKSKIVGIHEVSHGSLTATMVHPREVYKRAILNNACSIIVAHNHPSGDVTPSDEDVFLTKKLYEAGKIIGIKLLDHIIISSNDYYSFKGNELIED